MDLRELMIGDWVMYTSDKPENAFPIQVTVGMFNDEFVKWPNRFEPILIDENFVKQNFDEWDGGYGWINLENDIRVQYYLHEFPYYNAPSTSPILPSITRLALVALRVSDLLISTSLFPR